MRRIQIKVWPELEGYLPAIIPFDRIDRTKSNPIDIDLSNVSRVEASSLTLLLVKLIKSAPLIENRDWDIKFSSNPNINQQIVNLGFIQILKRYIPNNKLFLQDEYILQQLVSHAHQTINSVHRTFPIYELIFSNGQARREKVEEFKDFLVETLQSLYPKYKLKVNKLIQILHEIAKNSADHTEGNAFFGLDLNTNENELVIRFAFGDLGEGINQSVRRNVENDPSYSAKHKHLGITDSYNYAFKVGFTSKPNSAINRGIGMSTIFDLSKQINLSLSVFDAESRGLLSSATHISHAELRRIFYNVGFSVGFYYFGELKHAF